MWYRATAMHLHERMPSGSHVDASFAGLQDSAPRAALLGLHARMDGVEPSSWEHPSLVQIWFRLGADYVIPREDVDVFTIGTLPRDREQADALNALGDMVRTATNGTTTRTRELPLPDLPNPNAVRIAQPSGKIVIRWDARTTEVIPKDDPVTDPEEARLELARRFLHWFAPVGPLHFARWAAVPKADAKTTWEALESELVDVAFDGRARSVLASDESALSGATRPASVRLLPGMGDPFLYLDHDAAPRTPEVGPDVTQRLINSLAGRIFVDGDLVGAWGRAAEKVALFPWRPISRDRVGAEAESFAGPLGRDVRVKWLS